jgi:hypothetical protein
LSAAVDGQLVAAVAASRTAAAALRQPHTLQQLAQEWWAARGSSACIPLCVAACQCVARVISCC